VTHIGAQAETSPALAHRALLFVGVSNPRQLSPILPEVDPFLFDVPVLAARP
jgi:hypothetical protein